MLQFVIEASLNETKDDVIETDLDATRIYPCLVTTIDEEVVDALIQANL